MDFALIAELFERVEKASSRLDMADYLVEFFRQMRADETARFVFLAQGLLAPQFEGVNIGMGESFVQEAIASAAGYTKGEVERLYKQKGDLGFVAEELLKKKKQLALFSEKLTLKKVFDNLQKIANVSGAGSQDSKIRLLAELLNSANPLEARFVVRIVMENLRLGIGDPTIMDSLAILYSKEFVEKNPKITKEIEENLKEKNPEKRKKEFDLRVKIRLREIIEEKYNIHSDLGAIAQTLKENGLKGLEKIEIMPGIPIRPTLAERLPSAEEIIEKLGKCAVEAKYDGLRLAIHKNNEKVEIFSRNMEKMTSMFPEIIDAVKKQIDAKTAIFEGEALAVNETTGEYFPFQVTIQRKRKYDIKEKAAEYPLKLFAFDLMYLNGKNIMPLPFKERRQALEKIIKKGAVIEATKSIVTDSAKEMNKFFEDNVSKGLEGIIAKDLNARYIAGARKFAWIKLKRSYKGELSDSIDAVIIGYFKGRGKRTEFGLGGLLTAVYDEGEDMFKSIAKIGTGMSEQTLTDLEEMLSKIKRSSKPARVDSEIEPDFWCEPKHVIEVRADEITKSPIHTAGKKKDSEEGFALRFPRMIQMRSDKKPEQATTVKEIIQMFENQRKIATSAASEEQAQK